MDAAKLHSVSIGSFRMPNDYFANIAKLYPDEILFAGSFQKRGGLTGYDEATETAMVDFCQEQLLRYVHSDIYYRCKEN